MRRPKAHRMPCATNARAPLAGGHEAAIAGLIDPMKSRGSACRQSAMRAGTCSTRPRTKVARARSGPARATYATCAGKSGCDLRWEKWMRPSRASHSRGTESRALFADGENGGRRPCRPTERDQPTATRDRSINDVDPRQAPETKYRPATRELPAASRELPAASRELPAATRELPAATRELPAASRDRAMAVKRPRRNEAKCNQNEELFT